MADRGSALLNVAVFTPLALYALRGKKPPELLVVGSLLYAAAVFVRDVAVLLEPEPPAPAPDPRLGLK